MDVAAEMRRHERKPDRAPTKEREMTYRTFDLSTRKMECWGFFAAGFLIATIF